jgi:hypothetical protein
VKEALMLNPTTATTISATASPVSRALTAFAEDAPARLFTEPVDVSLLEDLEIDELGRRSRWLPADVLL